MKFVFPQNYNLNSKILGIIDYSTAIVDLIWGIFIFVLVNIFFDALTIKIFGFIIFVLPVFIFSIVGINGENMVYVMIYMIKYLFKQKIILYEKNFE